MNLFLRLASIFCIGLAFVKVNAIICLLGMIISLKADIILLENSIEFQNNEKRK